MLLTKHENQTFSNQTVYISGQAFIGCTFTACTLILRETVYHLQNCTFERCNWHVDWVLMWGSPESLREIKALVNLIEQAQKQAEQQAAESSEGSTESPPAGGDKGSPFAS
jgi:thiaminase